VIDPGLREHEIRAAATAWVMDRADRSGGAVTRAELEAFSYQGERIKLIDQSRGIRNPRQLAAAISILRSPHGPYDDIETADGLLRYAYRAGDPDGSDNRKLRAAHRLGLPLILLTRIDAGVFVPAAPVFVVADLPDRRFFEIAVDEGLRLVSSRTGLDDAQRRYVERLTKLRLHQPIFRARVLQAYDKTCAMCRLRHVELLDAAHILPDGHPRGLPVVPNGLSLCKIHHAAYDRDILGVRPDLIVEVRHDVLDEIDGPMLRHGLQEMAGARLLLPRHRASRPDPAALEERYEHFRRTG
jgi:putative restriction endonuclease